MDIAVEEEEMLIVIAGMDLCDMQASAGRRRYHRPGPGLLDFPILGPESSTLCPGSLSVKNLRTGTRASKIRYGEDVHVLGIPGHMTNVIGDMTSSFS